jgi:hypothetical protein
MVTVKDSGFFKAAMLMALLASTQVGAEVRGKAEIRFDYYPDTPLYPDQSSADLQPALALDLALHESLSRDITTRVSLFGRFNPQADNRFAGDLREAWLGYYGEQSEFYAGMLMERWGVLEAESIVDVLNPRDAVEDFQGDVKLGIPGLKASYLGEAFQLDTWLLPYARPRRLAEGKDRFRTTGLPLDEAAFEGGRNRLSAAVRLSTVQGNLEAAVAHFSGHARDPWFQLATDVNGSPTGLTPTYDLISQTSLELLWVQGHSLWKLEALHNRGPEDDFLAVGVGLEREFPRLWDTRTSLTLYAEGYYDGRAASPLLPLAPLQRDVFIGARIAMNDIKSTEYEIRITHDLEYASTFVDLRAARRLSDAWSIQATLYGFLNAEDDPALGTFVNDNRVEVKFIRNF